jgi:hypothetical protein
MYISNASPFMLKSKSEALTWGKGENNCVSKVEHMTGDEKYKWIILKEVWRKLSIRIGSV